MTTSKLCISTIFLGRYRVEWLDENNQVTQGFDCGSAMVLMKLVDWIFKPEAIQYEHDRQANSDNLGEAAIGDMKHNPQKYLPTKALPDPRDPDPTKEGIFRDHNCHKCDNGVFACVMGSPRQCYYPRARND